MRQKRSQFRALWVQYREPMSYIVLHTITLHGGAGAPTHSRNGEGGQGVIIITWQLFQSSDNSKINQKASTY